MTFNGHGPVGNRRQLIEYRDMLEAIYEAVGRMKRAGKTVDEIVKARPTTKFDAKWGTFVIDPDFFTSLVFKGI